jgi:peptide/nickel transport system substrate-binding protein
MTLAFRRARSLPFYAPVALAAFCLAAILVALALASRTNAGAYPADGGTLIEGEAGDAPHQINPLFAATSGPEADLTELVFSGLTRPGPGGDTQPDLADGWTVSTDGRDFTFHLRPNLTWQDGAPVSATDVVFTAKAFSYPGVKGDPATAEVWRRARVQAIGTDTVLIQFDAPFTPFLSYSSLGILPAHLLAGLSPAQLVSSSFNQHPIGTGPYRLTRLSSSEADLQRVAGFYLGTPYINTLRLKFLKDDNAVQQALRSHQIDSAMLPSPVAPGDLDALRASGHTLISGLRPVYTLVYLNLNAPQFQDAAVRQALSAATDHAALVRDAYAGQATPSDVPLPPGSYTGASSDAPAADPALAKALLAGDGWVSGSDGALQRLGIPLSFTLITTPDAQRTALARDLAQQWNAIGARVTVETRDPASLLNDVLLPQKYEAVLYGWDPGPNADPFPAWHSSQRGDAGSNLSNYANARADQLLETARGEPDADGRAAIYGAFVQQFRQNDPAIILFFPRFVYAAPQRLAGAQLGLLSSTADRFAAIETWSLATRKQ